MQLRQTKTFSLRSMDDVIEAAGTLMLIPLMIVKASENFEVSAEIGK